MRQTDIVSYLKRRLRTQYMGKQLRYLAITPSTMDAAREWAENGAAEGSAVIAGRQEAGRGRMGRSWLSPDGALATSLILRPSIKDVRLLPAISSIAVLRAIRGAGIKAEIKWPNDVLISGKKVCGILIENMFDSGNLVYSVIGIGINVNFDTSQIPEIADISTSLSVEKGKDISIAEMALNLYTELEDLYDHINRPDSILAEWVNHMVTIGKRVTANAGGCMVEGIAHAINSQGNLIVRLDDGLEREIVAGDVLNVRDKTY
jgi:BirA family transcriptional regulator, biotin operon repressor / biotin---[acetyl-CoA-carboxylase] ligase